MSDRELTREKYLSALERSSLEDLLYKHSESDFRNTTLIWTLLHTGARVSEVLAIRPKDLSVEGNTLFLQGFKGSRDRELPLTPFLFNRLKALSLKMGLEDKIFPFGYFQARNIWLVWRPAKKRIHSLRHTRALEIYRKTKDVRLVQKALGHRSLQTTLIYTDYDYSIDELRKALM